MIADMLSQAQLDELEQAFRLEARSADTTTEWSMEAEIDAMMGAVTSEYLWHTAWLFGIVVDNDLEWYIPDDYDTEIPLVSLDTPPKQLSVAEQEAA